MLTAASDVADRGDSSPMPPMSCAPPLAAMRAEVEVLAADADAAAAAVEASTAVLRRQLARSEELIDALLALARTQPELLDWEDGEFADVAREALEHMASAAAKPAVHIHST